MPSESSASSNSSSEFDLLREVDECCDRFEHEWNTGAAPETEEFAAALPQAVRQAAAAELLAIEWHYRGGKDDPKGVRSALSERAGLCALFESIGGSIDEALDRCAGHAHETRAMHAEEVDALHLRCPHCQNGVELLANAPREEITGATCGSTLGLVGSEAQEAATPRTIARFVLIERLGVGGFGAVWRARDPDLDRDVALKIPRGSGLSRQESELFFREARAAAQLSHPNIVPLHEVGRDGETIFIVSDLIQGESLAERLKKWSPTTREGAALLATVADALHYAHERGVVHRDMKPSNVMIDAKGKPYVMDFGLAKRDSGEITMTVEGQVLGTPAFMSPEQASGMASWVDRRTDVYSLGVMLFQLLTDELPFRGTAQSQLRQRLTEDAPSPRKFAPAAPLDLTTVCLKCLDRDPNKRYSTAAELADELRRFLRGEPVIARPLTPAARAWRWAKRRPAVASALALGAILAVAGPTAAIVIYQRGEEIQSRLEEITERKARDEAEIDRLEEEKDTLREEVASLRAGDDLLGAPTPGWRRELIESYLDEYQPQLEEKLAQAEGQVAIRGRLALAALLKAADRHEGAIRLLREADALLTDRLGDGSNESESDPAQLRLLAACRHELSQLLDDPDDAEESRTLAASAIALRRQLAESTPSSSEAQIDLLSTLMAARTAPMKDVAPQQLGAAAGLELLPRAEAMSKAKAALSSDLEQLPDLAEALLTPAR